MKRHVLFLFLIAACELFPRHAIALDQKTVNERIKEIKTKSQLDRDRLDRNLQDFQALSNSQKAQYRAMHAELAEDRAHAGGLSALMVTYSAWLNSLSPAQRDQVQNESDPARKLEIVRRIKEENEQPKVLPELHPDTLPPQPVLRIPSKGVLDAKDVAAVVKTITERLPPNQMKAEFERPQLESYLPIVNTSIQMYFSPKEWPDDTLLTKMIGAIHSKDQQNAILKSASKRDAMIRMLLTGIMKLARESVHLPTEEERLQTYDALSPAERQRIIAHHPDAVNWFLTQKFFEMKGDDSNKKLPEYRRKVLDLFERLEVQPPQWMSRPKQPRSPLSKG